ncbi:glutaredoxin family protein [Undibacterium fentianense]|uniref:Glutaredoxin family protein n=1 Tax=Undibacterium fentianense TaxID=2828728 RepID=A0A941DX87_9BURK|nr:glutaredoxin family protein [Undibacterium fentianense]MBR7798470.1 glutaredoxin family protein [Undibacterium fentianense]
MHFKLFSRSYCHLCDDMLVQLRTHLPSQEAAIDVIDVDEDENLVAQYDELVPVLVGKKSDGEWQEICHHFLDLKKLSDFLNDEN